MCTINQNEVLVTNQTPAKVSANPPSANTTYSSRRTSLESIPNGENLRISSEFDGQIINHSTSCPVSDVTNQQLSKQNSFENSQSGGSVDSLTVNSTSSHQQPIVSHTSNSGGLTQKSFQDLEKKLAALRNADSVDEVCI